MDPPNASQPPSNARDRRGPLVFAVLSVAIVGALWAAWSVGTWSSGRSAVEIETPYRNARPGVAYVGDEVCARCHAEIAGTYRRHPMGRSLTTIDAAPAEFRGEAGRRELFDHLGFTYSDQSRDGRTFHREARLDDEGRVVAEVEGEVRYVLGSGTRARAFLIEREGFLFQSPITWYAQRRDWGLAPGYEGANPHLERPVEPGCLFCHANRVDHVSGTRNRYREPIFDGHAIGCERCHGPGELHARRPFAGEGEGPNIVNPGALEPARREEVCQQCHLIGEASVIEHPGGDVFDYRPGLPLARFETVFVRPEGEPSEHRNADHVEQMHRSRCFLGSDGALGCISCHDPHARPEPSASAAYYRERCLQCHAEHGCALPVETRRAGESGDDCVACHMPRAATSDVPHVATTDHRIPRRPEAEDASAGERESDPMALVPFHRAQLDDEGRRRARRDLALVLYIRGEPGAALALRLLGAALATDPNDVLAREDLGYALGVLGRAEEGLASVRAALELAPLRETALVVAATLAGQAGHREQAIDSWRRAIAVNPYRSSYHAPLAELLARAGRWSEAAESSRRALALDPAQLSARFTLIQSLVRLGSTEEARAEFDRLLGFDPPGREGVVRWFETLR